jgi:adenylosuccinate synthase
VKIGVAYSINGTRLLPGQMESIEGCTDFDSLPDNAKAYVHRIEELAGCPVSWIGTGPKREQMVQNFE